MQICIYSIEYNRCKVARKIQETGLVGIAVFPEVDHNLLFEILCQPEYADKLFTITHWNRVPTSPVFYPSGTPKENIPVTFVVAGVSEDHILGKLCQCLLEVRESCQCFLEVVEK